MGVERGLGNGWRFVFLGVEVPPVLFSFLFALCVDISVEDRGAFSGDNVLSVTSLGCFLYYLITSLFGFFFPVIAWSLCSIVIGQLKCFVRPVFLSISPGEISPVRGRIARWGSSDFCLSV